MCRSRRGRRFCESRYSLSVQAGRSLRGLKRAWRVAGLRGRRLRPARLCEPQEHSPFILGHSLRSISALRIRGLRADRCHGELAIRSRPKIKPKAQLIVQPNPPPQPSPMLGLARRENRIRFSRPKNKHSPKLVPVLRPVSASLRLRCRSATAVARGNSCRIGRMPTGRICPLKRAGDGVFAQNRVFRAPWEILSKHASAF